MATARPAKPGPISALGAIAVGVVTLLGDFSLFSFQTIGWLFWRRPAPGTLLPSFYLVGVRSVPVVAVTGMFIGMVMAVQMFPLVVLIIPLFVVMKALGLLKRPQEEALRRGKALEELVSKKVMEELANVPISA